MSVSQPEPWRILHVDDDEDDYLIVKMMLNEARGRKVWLEWAPSIEAARSKLVEDHYQAVLVDYDLGFGSGIELIREFVDRDYPAPLILLTGRGSYEVDVEAMRAGATLYLTKDEINALLLERSIRYAIERKHTEQELRARDQKLSIALEAAQLGAWIYSFSDHKLELDERARRMYRADQPVVSHDQIIAEFLHPEDSQAMWSALEKAADPGGDGSYQTEYRIFQADGSVCWLKAWGIVEFEGQGEERRAVRLVGATRDITWEKQAHLALQEANGALQESEARFRDLANNIAQLAWMADASGWIFWYNQRWFDYTGTTLEEMQGWGWQKVHHPDHVQRVVKKIGECFRTGEFWEDIFPIRGKDGQYRWFLSRAVPICDEDGRVLRWFGTNTDVTEGRRVQSQLKERNEVLRQSEERFAKVFQSNPAGLAIMHIADGRFQNVNDSLCQMLGYAPEEMIGRTPLELGIFTKSFEPAEIVRRLRAEGSLRNEEMTLQARSGELHSVLYSVEFIEVEGQTLLLTSCINVTRRKRAEELLRVSESKFMAIFENAPFALILTRLDTGEIVDANPAWLEMFGFTKEEALGSTSLQLGAVLDSEIRARGYEELRQHGRLRNFELSYQTNTGKPFLVSNNANVITIEGEAYLLSASEDITERKQTVDALRKSEEKFRQLADAMPQLVWTAQPDGSVDYYNQRYQSYAGIALAAQGHWEWAPVLHADDWQPTVEAWNRAVATGETYQIEHRICMADGDYRWHLSRGIPFYDDNGRLTKWYGTATDIHDFKMAEQALRESENRFRVALASAPISVYTTDCQLRLTWMHDFHPGFDPQSVLGLRLDQVVPGEYGEALVAIQQSVLDTGQSQQGEFETWIDGEQIHYTYYISPVRDNHGNVNGLACAGYDITGSKQAEKDLYFYARELERSNLALQDFAFIASHDLQEPLRKIILFGNNLRQKMQGLLPEEAERTVERMQDAASRMQKMIDGLLDLSRINMGGGEFERVDLSEVVKEVLSDLEARIQVSGGQVIVGHLPAVQGDTVQLRQLMQNLIGNALKYHQEGVQPVVRISGEVVRIGKTRLARIAVEDNGIGFDPDLEEQIFQPFVRLHGRKRYEGTGIGLAICRKIVERHGGSITASSQPGQGSRFTVTLPVNPQALSQLPQV